MCSGSLLSAERHDLFSVDGCRIAWWSAGRVDGLPVVLLHGFALDHTVWAPLCMQSKLLEHCRLVMPDLRGHGASDRMPTAAHYTNGAVWAEDLAVLIRGLGQGLRPTVVAWSFGGRSVLDYVRHYGTSNLHGILFVAAAGLAHAASTGPGSALLTALCADQSDLVRDTSVIFIHEVLGVARDCADFNRLLVVVEGCPVQHRRWMRQRSVDYDALIAELDLPLMWVNGEHDSIVLPARAAAMRALQPDIRVSIYPGAGHAPFLDDPARFARELLQFIDDPPPRRRHAPSVADPA